MDFEITGEIAHVDTFATGAATREIGRYMD